MWLDQVNQFRAPFLTNFLFLFVSSSYQKIPKSVTEHRSLLIPISKQVTELVKRDRVLLGMERTDPEDRQAWRGRLRP